MFSDWLCRTQEFMGSQRQPQAPGLLPTDHCGKIFICHIRVLASMICDKAGIFQEPVPDQPNDDVKARIAPENLYSNKIMGLHGICLCGSSRTMNFRQLIVWARLDCKISRHEWRRRYHFTESGTASIPRHNGATDADPPPVATILAGLPDTTLHGLADATRAVTLAAPGLLAWIEGAADWE